jgi:hypothetical protein
MNLFLSQKKLDIHCPPDTFTDAECEAIFDALDSIDLKGIVVAALNGNTPIDSHKLNRLIFTEE